MLCATGFRNGSKNRKQRTLNRFQNKNRTSPDRAGDENFTMSFTTIGDKIENSGR
jgi:hypothetical protein